MGTVFKTSGGVESMELLDDRVIVRKKVAFDTIEQQFFFNQIERIEYVKAGLLTAKGHLAILLAGQQGFQKPANQNTKDPRFEARNVVTFWSNKNKEAIAFKQQMEDAIKEYAEKTSFSAPTQASSTADEIAKYKELFDSGVITEEEYNAKKSQLLGL